MFHIVGSAEADPTKGRISNESPVGKEVRVKGEGLLARALQHEIDHLDGVLYTDRLEKPEDLYRITETRERVPAFQGGVSKPAPEKEPALA